jgi:hypothetical protein
MAKRINICRPINRKGLLLLYQPKAHLVYQPNTLWTIHNSYCSIAVSKQQRAPRSTNQAHMVDHDRYGCHEAAAMVTAKETTKEKLGTITNSS